MKEITKIDYLLIIQFSCSIFAIMGMILGMIALPSAFLWLGLFVSGVLFEKLWGSYC